MSASIEIQRLHHIGKNCFSGVHAKHYFWPQNCENGTSARFSSHTTFASLFAVARK